jgi:hypothetical protein
MLPTLAKHSMLVVETSMPLLYGTLAFDRTGIVELNGAIEIVALITVVGDFAAMPIGASSDKGQG